MRRIIASVVAAAVIVTLLMVVAPYTGFGGAELVDLVEAGGRGYK